jgi:NAD(P)-dependent dehydrogenase (short-subunit alcohol dehydrogenase family)
MEDTATEKSTPSLAGQVAVITCAGRGIGAAIAAKLAALGASVVLCGRTRGPLESTSNAISKAGGRAEVLPCDVTDLHSIESAAAHVDQTLGGLDILVNNAGVGGLGDLCTNCPLSPGTRS